MSGSRAYLQQPHPSIGSCVAVRSGHEPRFVPTMQAAVGETEGAGVGAVGCGVMVGRAVLGGDGTVGPLVRGGFVGKALTFSGWQPATRTPAQSILQ